MEGFKKLPKMQSFKTGGVVNKYCGGGPMKKGGAVEHDDIAEDKKIVKKAIAMHDKQEHKGEKTDLSKLSKGGRSKKAVGTVKKFSKTEAPSGDLSPIKKVTAAPKAAAAPSAPVEAPVEEMSMPFKKGGKAKKLKKYADGGKAYSDDDFDIGRGALDTIGKVPGIGGFLKNQATDMRNKVLGTPAQNRIAQERMDKIAAQKAADATKKAALLTRRPGAQSAKDAAMAAGMAGGAGAAAAPSAPTNQPTGLPPAAPAGGTVPGGMKRGGKTKKCK